ncbi:hypothetical protein [Pseudobacillus badius]|uniref:hypothetical protein n=1 Tax=Bacillus badius TaxID=1455 RepID=UPI000B26842E|nr:hypothetical protein [Bacillus badius]
MKKKVLLRLFGIAIILGIALAGGLKSNTVWALLLLPFFFIGDPWYKGLNFKKKKLV